jgi:hypothetical protein
MVVFSWLDGLRSGDTRVPVGVGQNRLLDGGTRDRRISAECTWIDNRRRTEASNVTDVECLTAVMCWPQTVQRCWPL